MIYLDRKKISVPTVLDGNSSRGAKETLRAIKHYTNPYKKAFKFTVYSDEKVKDALVQLCNKKCAYCESRFLHTYPGDVEHFRPKAEITGSTPTKPGYYWLAADWENLLLSCRNCNQKLKHLLHGNKTKKTLGKMNQFPLNGNDTYRVRRHDDPAGVGKEKNYTLLIDPSAEDPEHHLEYDQQHAVIKPKQINGVPSPKGINSIQVYVLQRVPLVLAREKVLIDILAQIQRVKEATKNVSDHLNEDTTIQFYFDGILNRELKRLHDFMDPTAEYSAMAKQVINDFIKQNQPAPATASSNNAP